jgi:hypothetical protein
LQKEEGNEEEEEEAGEDPVDAHDAAVPSPTKTHTFQKHSNKR